MVISRTRPIEIYPLTLTVFSRDLAASHLNTTMGIPSFTPKAFAKGSFITTAPAWVGRIPNVL